MNVCPGYAVYLQTFFLLVCVYVPRPGCFAFAELLLVCVCVCVRALLPRPCCFALTLLTSFLYVCVCAGAHLLDEAVVCVPRPCCYSLADLLPA